MRLLKVDAPELELVEFFGDRIPPYAILSHTWSEDEVLYQDLQSGHYRHKLGYIKIRYACDQARRDDLDWCWVDTCCIDKSSSAELSEAINSMFNWYKRARVCYAYLADVRVHGSQSVQAGELPEGHSSSLDADQAEHQRGFKVSTKGKEKPTDNELADETLAMSEWTNCSPHSVVRKAIHGSRWFERGWTLQELIAPHFLSFYDASWCHLGDRDLDLLDLVFNRTGLSSTVLGNPEVLRDIPIAHRMSWMAHRKTTRKEDIAYCMLGLFCVNMPLLYGEEDMAFIRLQEELARRFDDQSLFVFHTDSFQHYARSLLAASPEDFAGCIDLEKSDALEPAFIPEPYRLTSDGLHISLPLIQALPPNRATLIEIALLNLQSSGSLIGLALYRDPTSARTNVRYITRETTIFDMHGIVPVPSLGTGVVSIPLEIAITAKRQAVVIRQALFIRPAHRRHFKTWLRYDLAFQYEFASLGCVLRDTVAMQRKKRPPHMISLNDSSSAPSEVDVFHFSLAEVANVTITVAFASRQLDWNPLSVPDVRGALLVTETRIPTSEQQQLALDLLGSFMDQKDMSRGFLDNVNDEGDRVQATKARHIASAHLEGYGDLELWHEPRFEDWVVDQSLVTLQFKRCGSTDKNNVNRGLLSDGTREYYRSVRDRFSGNE